MALNHMKVKDKNPDRKNCNHTLNKRCRDELETMAEHSGEYKNRIVEYCVHEVYEKSDVPKLIEAYNKQEILKKLLMDNYYINLKELKETLIIGGSLDIEVDYWKPTSNKRKLEIIDLCGQYGLDMEEYKIQIETDIQHEIKEEEKKFAFRFEVYESLKNEIIYMGATLEQAVEIISPLPNVEIAQELIDDFGDKELLDKLKKYNTQELKEETEVIEEVEQEVIEQEVIEQEVKEETWEVMKARIEKEKDEIHERRLNASMDRRKKQREEWKADGYIPYTNSKDELMLSYICKKCEVSHKESTPKFELHKEYRLMPEQEISKERPSPIPEEIIIQDEEDIDDLPELEDSDDVDWDKILPKENISEND